ncbi:Endogenous retrovirus group FC1 Env polyprotein, partial [Plecturocebus cupreus]
MANIPVLYSHCTPAVPLWAGFNLSQSPIGPSTTLTGIPLFKEHSQNLCYGKTSSFSLSRNTSVKIKSTLYAPPGGYFWYNGTLTKVINASLPFPCVPTILVPQSEVYAQAELLSLIMPSLTHRNKRAVFLPITVGLSLASSLAAARIGSRAMGYSFTSAAQREDKLRVAIEASATSLASLQQQITSLAQVTLQNRQALDLLMAEKGGTCLFLKEQCCYYISETGLVEENVNTLYRREDLQKKQDVPASSLNWWQSPMLTWLAPIVTPIIVGCLLLMLVPFLLKFLE